MKTDRPGAPDELLTRRDRVRFACVLAIMGVVIAYSNAGCELVPDPAAQHSVGMTARDPDIERPDWATDPSAVYAKQGEVIQGMRRMYPTVKVELLLMPCGQENSFYNDGVIILCTEMEAHPSAALMFAAHEMGHGVTHQLAGIVDEQAADEVGALALISLGMTDQLLEAALYYKRQAVQAHYEGDPHPSNKYRAWEMACLADGSEPTGTTECQEFYRSTKKRWDLRLHDAQKSD